MSGEFASTAMAELIKSAAAPTTSVLGERKKSDVASNEPARPYFRVSFLRMGAKTNVPGRMRGVALVECYAVDGVRAWALGTKLTETMGLNSAPVMAPDRPSAISDYRLDDAGWLKGNSDVGGLVYCNIIFHYFDK